MWLRDNQIYTVLRILKQEGNRQENKLCDFREHTWTDIPEGVSSTQQKNCTTQCQIWSEIETLSKTYFPLWLMQLRNKSIFLSEKPDTMLHIPSSTATLAALTALQWYDLNATSMLCSKDNTNILIRFHVYHVYHVYHRSSACLHL